jgi:hypothetical protein
LTAQVLDAVRLQSYYLLKINGSDPAEPVNFPRPGAVPVVPEIASLADFGAFLRR